MQFIDDIQNVTVGEVAHPMSEEHSIEWVSIKTKQGNQRKVLSAGSKPQVTFFNKLLISLCLCNSLTISKKLTLLQLQTI